MINFEYISTRGDVLSLSNGLNYKLINFDGQTNANSNLSSITSGSIDGDSVNNIRVEPRTIIIDLRILADVELTKREILEVIKIKQQGTIRWTQNERTVEIKGKVESIELPRWSISSVMQITMHCEQPFWEDLDYIISNIDEVINKHYFTTTLNDMLYFPFDGIVMGEFDIDRVKSIYNAGDVSVGLEIEIAALKTVTNPIIYNQNNKFFGCGYGTSTKQVVMNAGDTIKIITRKNEKIVTLNGVSILDKVKPNSTWLQLEAGDNSFSINSDDSDYDNMSFSLTYKQRYV